MENSVHYKLRVCHINCQKNIICDLKKKTELKPGEPKILEFLLEHAPCEQKEIALGCELDPSSVTGILGRMEARNLVIRGNRNKNRRSLYVSMTEKGKRMAKEVEESFGRVDSQAVRGLSKEEQKEFFRLLDMINHNLQEAQE